MAEIQLRLSSERPHPTKIAFVNDRYFANQHSAMGTIGGPLFGVPAVVDIDGEAIRLQTSQFVPPGDVWVADTALLALPQPDEPHHG